MDDEEAAKRKHVQDELARYVQGGELLQAVTQTMVLWQAKDLGDPRDWVLLEQMDAASLTVRLVWERQR